MPTRMAMWNEFLLIAGCYLLGSLPFMYIMGRLHGVDLRKYDDSHITLWREVGRVEGSLGVILDFAKGVVAVVAARAVGFDIGWVAFAGVAAVAGQMWPVFLNFNGEKGNSIGLAMSSVLATTAMLFALIPMVAGFLIRTIPRFRQADQSVGERLRFGGPPSNSLPVGMALGFAVLPIAAWALGYEWQIVVAFAGVFGLILLRRATADISQDWGKASDHKTLLLNRVLYDRSDL
jgi:glycerol-3-phosphate acyltransferase PlsY